MVSEPQTEPLVLEWTEDGSPTLYSPRFQEHYHSTHGALAESRHVFVDNGLALLGGESPVRILEYGFGLGVNFLVAVEWAWKTGHAIEYTTLERYPVGCDLLAPLHFSVEREVYDYWCQAHRLSWDTLHTLAPWLHFQKVLCDFLIYVPFSPVDIVFFDAFSPTRVPEQWCVGLFATIRDILSSTGFLVTYSASGVVKQALREAGFRVKRRPGALGKHHMLQAFIA